MGGGGGGGGEGVEVLISEITGSILAYPILQKKNVMLIFITSHFSFKYHIYYLKSNHQNL